MNVNLTLRDAPEKQSNLILEDISKSFGERRVLRGVTLHFEGGGNYCIMGPSGCGKTTLLHIVLGILKPDSGIRKFPQNISFAPVFQEDRLCENLSVGMNIRLTARCALAPRILDDALSAVGMGNAAKLPAHTLSGGMKRRVALLRALLSGGDLLVFDEPFKGLDDDTRRRAMDCVRDMRAGRSLIWASHDRAEAKYLNADIISDAFTSAVYAGLCKR